MTLFEMTAEELVAVPATDFATEGVWERRDLQRLLRDNIATIDDTLLVVAEEFGDFEGSDRRIDLLCVDREGRLVVVELKRTHDGGHMDLQALRYAAMVSSMIFEQLVEVFERHLARVDPTQQDAARDTLAAWLEDAGGDEAALSGDVRIVLVSAGFGSEITTTVLWLTTTYNLDITCVRLVPHRVGDRLLLDITQLVPLPEAEEFTVKLRRREQAVRASSDGRDWTQYVVASLAGESKPLRKRWAVLEMVTALHTAGVSMPALVEALPNSRLISADGVLTGDDLVEKFSGKYPAFHNNLGRWFTEHPLHDGETTWLLSKMWGRQTVHTLDRLLALAPNGQFSYRAVH
jgi:hypothetical protein